MRKSRLTNKTNPATLAPMNKTVKPKAKPAKVKVTTKDLDVLRDLADTLEVDAVLDLGVINPDPGMCPNCGGDLDDGDHAFCSRF